MDKKKLALVGIFYDGYIDSWKDFLRNFYYFWPDCPYELYIVSNETTLIEYDKVNWIPAGKDAEYSKKVQAAIDQIDADYLLLMLEDFYFGASLGKMELEPVLEYVVTNDIKYYCLSSLSSFTKYYSELYDKNIPYLYKINPKKKYTLGCQAVIWEKNFLKSCIGTRNYNAWVFEGALAQSKRTHTEEFLNKCVKDTRNILKLQHGILQQKLLPPTVQYFKNIGLPLSSNREIMSEKSYRRYVRNARLSASLPRPIYKLLKSIIGKKRGNAVLDKYEKEIQVVIRENFGE